MPDKLYALQQAAEKVGVGKYTRHVLLCTGPTCCSNQQGQAAWETLKLQLKERGLTSGEQQCFRSKVGCLRICEDGPTLVVYPDGTWYSGMTAERIPRLVQEHLVEGRPIHEWIFARNPLTHEADQQ